MPPTTLNSEEPVIFRIACIISVKRRIVINTTTVFVDPVSLMYFINPIMVGSTYWFCRMLII